MEATRDAVLKDVTAVIAIAGVAHVAMPNMSVHWTTAIAEDVTALADEALVIHEQLRALTTVSTRCPQAAVQMDSGTPGWGKAQRPAIFEGSVAFGVLRTGASAAIIGAGEVTANQPMLPKVQGVVGAA